MEFTKESKINSSVWLFCGNSTCTDGLIHISELDHKRVDKVEDVCKEGDILKFKVIGQDPKTKKIQIVMQSFNA
jgi:ribosomal protein S1